MRIALWSLVFVALSAASGCNSGREAVQSRKPLVVGKLESGTFWKTSLQGSTTSNEGGGYDKGSQVDVYDTVVVVTTPDGVSHVHPHGFYSDLAIKKE